MLVAQQATACFGPKLFIGVSPGPENEVLFALVTLYVKEKTGVESLVVEASLESGMLDLIDADKADMVFVVSERPLQNTVFNVKGFPVLVTGKRPLEELQFTTVLPAVKKLNGLLRQDDLAMLVNKVKSGESAMQVVRKFFMENRWI